MKKMLKALLIVILAIVLVAGIYLAYVFLSYHRIEDNQQMDVDNAADVGASVETGKDLELTSWNIGFAAYLQDYTFFMDGGKESRARSKDAVLDSMQHITEKLNKEDSDFYNIQEVDFDATRSYKVDERALIRDAFADCSYTFAQNYDSPYLFYPFTSPHGANKAGIITMSKSQMTDALRRSLPIQTDVAKVLDLDRCYSITRMPADDGKEMILINLHLSAYTTDPTIVQQQIKMVYDTMLEEYNKGNYVVASGDFNMDLLQKSPEIFGVEMNENASWCQPYPVDGIPEHIQLVAPFDENKKIASCRNNDMPYQPGTTFTCTVDGFLVTDNVKVVSSEVLNEEFMYSDHNPVQLHFVLGK